MTSVRIRVRRLGNVDGLDIFVYYLSGVESRRVAYIPVSRAGVSFYIGEFSPNTKLLFVIIPWGLKAFLPGLHEARILRVSSNPSSRVELTGSSPIILAYYNVEVYGVEHGET